MIEAKTLFYLFLQTLSILLIVLYYVVRNGVKNGIKQAYHDITGKETYEDRLCRQMMNGEIDFEEGEEQSEEENKGDI